MYIMDYYQGVLMAFRHELSFTRFTFRRYRSNPQAFRLEANCCPLIFGAVSVVDPHRKQWQNNKPVSGTASNISVTCVNYMITLLIYKNEKKLLK